MFNIIGNAVQEFKLNGKGIQIIINLKNPPRKQNF